MAEFEPLRPFTDFMWHARQELKQAGDPAADLLKLASTIMPGKFASSFPDNKYYRPVLAQYIWQSINRRLQTAMDTANNTAGTPGPNVYRFCVDGFIANTDIERTMNVGNELGQWKPVKRHRELTIAKTNVWWTDREYKDGGYGITKEALLAGLTNDPFEVSTTRTHFDWTRLEEVTEPITLRQSHTGMLCRACWDGDSTGLHDVC
jgi:hypothetical protein